MSASKTCLLCREHAKGGWEILVCNKCLPICAREEDIDLFLDEMGQAIARVIERNEVRWARRERAKRRNKRAR